MSIRRANTVVSIIVLLALLIQPLATGAGAAGLQSGTSTALTPAPKQPGQGFLFRASVTLAGSRNLARLEKVGVLVLDTFDSDGAQTALVLADGEQLADLARLGFRPQAADELRLLVSAQGPEKAWLVESLQPLLAQADVVVALQVVAGVAGVTAAPDATAEAVALQALRTSLRALTPEQIAAVANSSSVDDDADGLTNTQEAWWCTDPMDTDTDDDGRTDGAEIQVLKDWMANERAGAPNETPWPSWPFNTTTCPDKDHDSIPNLAERWELGLNMDLESSDRDKFDDGQELFGVTYCPGGDLSCGYGDLPRSSDSGYVGAAMPSWVKAPGKHPLVAAFPVPEVDVVESSLHVETVTEVTTDHVIASGTEKSYSTAKTEGTSTSIADTVTWNDWQEVSRTDPIAIASAIDPQFFFPNDQGDANRYLLKTTASGLSMIGGLAGLAACPISFGLTCALGIAALSGGVLSFVDTQLEAMDQIQARAKANKKDATTNPAQGVRPPTAQEQVDRQGTTATHQDTAQGGGGTQISTDTESQVNVQNFYPVTYPVQRSTITQSSGHSWGGAQTNTHTQYEEQTITNGEAFSSDESWGSATAVDSAHSADLWFTYNVRNSGTEYAREIKHLAFNIYIGDNPNPACTYHVGSMACGVPVDTVLFANFMPGEEHPYTSFRIPLTLEQMKTVDLGGPIRVVVEDFTYGADELFYQDAANAGVLIAMEDGTDDGEEAIDTYLVPTWGTETVLDVLARYFPHTTDADGMLTAIWTPEYRADTPAWCVAPQVVGIGAQRTLWCKHALSTADWWNVYTDGMGDGSEGFQDTPASPGQVALFRFNKDSDLDGYSDRSEARLGTDPNDPADYPRPELLAGVHTIRSGRQVTATLSLLNTGLYDAYGVEAVMIAPNNTISITNNTVGGSGRVRAQKQVIVGSRIATQTPLPAAWLTAGHAQPAAGGYYSGASDRTYTFTVQCGNSGGCVVGTDAWTLAWNDGEGVNGSLSFDATYKSPTLRDIGAFGVKLGFLSGKVNNGESFTAAATTPRDTFQYTIAAGHETDFTPPVVLVSYNDPQGNHRFVIPSAAMSLTTPAANLMAFSGQMLRDPGVEIVTGAAFTAGTNTTDLVVNNPTETTLTDANLFLEFIDTPNPDVCIPEDPSCSGGHVVSEASVTVPSLPPGPSVVPVAWDTAAFDPPYDSTQDYIVMSFWTDYQGNILDTAARPLSSFQEDPKPAFTMTSEDETWDFGTAQQGTLMQRQFALASVGYADLLTHIGSAISITVEGPASQPLPPGDMAVYTVMINTQYLPVGPFEETIPVRTSDPDNPTKDITIRGDITPMPEDAPGGAILRPLDWTLTVPGAHSQGEWYEYAHTLGPDPQTLHPVKVYSQDYATLWGVGKYATDFAQGTSSADMFGDGLHGDILINTTQTFATPMTRFASTAAAGQKTVYFESTTAFDPGNEILLIQMQGAGAGAHEFARVTSHSGQQYVLQDPLTNTYTQDATSKAQAVFVHHFHNVTVTSGVEWAAPAWNGSEGGIIVFRANGMVAIDGSISAQGKGFRGGSSTARNGTFLVGNRGEGTDGPMNIRQYSANGNGGGGGGYSTNDPWDQANGGGGGGNGSTGSQGRGTGGGNNVGGPGGYGGSIRGTEDLSTMALGGGGGGGGVDNDSRPSEHAGYGGNGGGIVFIIADSLVLGGGVNVNGSSGEGGGAVVWKTGAGGSGAGGSVLIKAENAVLGTDRLIATGGPVVYRNGSSPGDGDGGAGGSGRIRIEYCESLAGTTNPSASTQELNCYIVEQIETPPYDHGRLNLPESFSDSRTYQIQYGRRYVFTDTLQSTQSIRMPKQLYATATMDALVSNTGISSGDLSLSLDIGNDGIADWAYNNTTAFPISFTLTSLANALNAYMVDRTGVAWGADIDVPMKLTINRQADVILTNLVLTLQSNQPPALSVASIDTGADRPLDWTEHVGGAHNQGETYDYEHSIGPDPVSIHPCKVHDQAGSILKGVGEYCTDFGDANMPSSIFGDGADGDFTGGDSNSVRTSLTSNIAASQPNLTVASTSGFLVSDEVMVHQTQGTGAGTYEFGTISMVNTGSQVLVLRENLRYPYYQGGNSHTQVIRVPHFRNVGGSITASSWNGNTGGIVVFRANGAVSSSIDVTAKGFRGGQGLCCDGTPQQGESYPGLGAYHSQSSNGGGGGDGNPGAGGGGGYGSAGGNGQSQGGDWDGRNPGYGGQVYGSQTLSVLHLGSGGGGGDHGGAPYGQWGGRGGGAVYVAARSLSGTIGANGESLGGWNTGNGTLNGAAAGGGSGGSINLICQTCTLGSGNVNALGGTGGTNVMTRNGGAGGVGRIHIEYQMLSGGTNPSAFAEERRFFSAEQVEQSPFTTTRLYLPDTFADGQTYLVQYGRRFVFSGSGQQTSYLRVNRRMYGTASLDMLVSNTGVSSGNLDLCLDIGNDGDCDYHSTGTQTFPLTLSADALADAFNDYLVTRSDIAWGDPVDVPVRVQVDRAADVMLTNLALTPVGAKTRFLRLPARDYADVTLDILFGQTGDSSGPLAFTVDVGADGTVDWTDSQNLTYPATVHSPSLAAAFNSYLGGRTGEVDVPIRITPSPSLFTTLDAFMATPTAQPDATLGSADISFGATDPVEGDEVLVSATLHNTGGLDTGRITASFYATSAVWGEWYIGSAFVSNVPAGGTAQAEILWNTLGFTGATPVRVSIDPYDRLAETNETNNEASKSLTIKTRPDLRVTQIALSDNEPTAGEPVTVTLTLRNEGQTAAAASVLALYDGNPDAEGTLVGESSPAVAPAFETTVSFAWAPTAAGAHQLFTRADRDRQVGEYDEGNNDTWRNLYVGFASPLLVDSGGGDAYDPAYSETLGFGYLNGEANTFCGTSSNGSQRNDWSGQVQYRFDHLLPGHFYHLDLTLYECDGLGRQEQVRIDDNVISDPIDLSDLAPHRLSFRLDPAFYADRSIVVSIEELLGNDAVVSEVNLYDIGYRYADAGGSTEADYSAARTFGPLDGVKQTTWGTLPYQSRRIDLGDSNPDDDPDNELRYRYDALQPSKHYQLLITVYQGSGTATVQQTVAVDSVDTGVMLEVTGIDRDDKVIDVPVGMYSGDGSIVVRITRLNATAGAFVNEIALEELTLLPEQVTQVTQSLDLHTGGPNWFSFNVKPPVRPAAACTGVTATSAFTSVYGDAILGSAAAPVGSLVEAYSPAGVKTGCFKVTAEGLYGYMRVYGTEGATPGMSPGDPIIFKINGIVASPTPYPVIWQNDKAIRQVDLVAADVIPVETLLVPLAGAYTKLQCESGTYLPPPADPRFNTCTTVAPGQGYLLWTMTASALSVTGTRVASDQPISLHAGYNWLGYLPTCELPVATALVGIAGKYDLLHSEAGTYRPPPANPAYNNFNTMAPGRGYMIHMTEAATLIYPADLCGTAMNAPEPVAAPAFSCSAAPTSRFTHFYGQVTAAAGAPVTATSPRGEVVGCGQVGEGGLLPYLRVYGAEGATPGMNPGESIRLTAAGQPLAVQAIWRGDWDVHLLGVDTGPERVFLPVIAR